MALSGRKRRSSLPDGSNGKRMTMSNALPKAACVRAMVAAMLGMATVSCASNSQESGFNAFLQTIATECKPLIIGSDNIGQAIIFNGPGAQPDNYNNFLGQTKALYNGSIPATVYRNSLNSFLGGGSSNERSFNCIIAHLPKS
jgi:hypothetical protein